MGIGCGGPSRVGQSTGKKTAESVAIIRQALHAGVNFIDTAEAYGTEEIVGRAIRAIDRDSVLLSTKKTTWTREPIKARDVERSLEASLERLGTDHVDVYHLHGVAPQAYDRLASEIVPTLERLRDQGKVRFLGITEAFNSDPAHAMLQRAMQDDVWDVVMVGFNLLNQSARETVLAKAMEKDTGVLVMFAVRLALSRPERLREVIDELVRAGQVNPGDVKGDALLDLVVHEGGAVSLPDAAYRFCRDEPGTHVVLVGTGNPDHLQANVASFSRPPLPPEDVIEIRRMFGRVDSVSGQ
jgi:aryl-alcohol dehydrogenase-like predicted oxidoreductase